MAKGRWRRRAGWLVVLVLGLAAVGFGLSVSGVRLARSVLADPKARDALLERVFDGRGVSVDYRHLEVVETDRWAVMIDGLAVVTPTARVSVAHAECGVPGLWSMLLGRVDLGDVRVDGLKVTVPKRPLPVSRGGLPLRVVVDRLRVRDGVLHMLEDGELPEVRADGVEADLRKLVVVGGGGVVGGRGSLGLQSLRTGRVHVTEAAFEAVRLSRTRHHFGDGRLRVAGGGASGQFQIQMNARPRPALHAELRVRDGDLAQLVHTITGVPSPVQGRLSGEVTVDAGGARDLGDALTVADVELTGGALLLGPKVPAVLEAALKVAPFIKVQKGRVLLGPTRANLRMAGGVVELQRLVHSEAGKKSLAARGRIEGKSLDLVVRLVPKKKADRRAGLGLVIQGEPGNLSVRRAKAGELAGVGDLP